MEAKESVERYTFESREVYDLACKENELVRQLREKANLAEPKNALKVYNKAVADKLFETVVGYAFLEELRTHIIKSGVAEEGSLAEIPVQEIQKEERDTMPRRPAHGDRFQRLYEGQVLLNKKLKIALTAMVLLVIGFIVINFRFEYTIFTFFTNYKANMEEELITKYEDWEAELQEREQKLEQSEGAGQNG